MQEKIIEVVKMLLKKYNAEYAILFGSYARGDATPDSDIDLIIVGGKGIHTYAIGEEMREILKKDVDIFNIREIKKNTPFYENIQREGVKIAC